MLGDVVYQVFKVNNVGIGFFVVGFGDCCLFIFSLFLELQQFLEDRMQDVFIQDVVGDNLEMVILSRGSIKFRGFLEELLYMLQLLEKELELLFYFRVYYRGRYVWVSEEDDVSFLIVDNLEKFGKFSVFFEFFEDGMLFLEVKL